MIGHYTLAEVWSLGMIFAMAFTTIFMCVLIVWAIRKLKTGKDARAWCKAYRDKPPYDLVADLSLISAMLYLLWIKMYNKWRKS